MRSTPPLPPRKRRRIPSRSPSEDERRTDLTVDVCKDFRRSICRHSEVDCKFAHPHSTVTVEKTCADALRNKCFRGRTCRYYHPPSAHSRALKAIGVQEPKVEQYFRERILQFGTELPTQPSISKE